MTKRLAELIEAADKRDQANERTRERWRRRNQRRKEMRAKRPEEPSDEELDRRAAEMLAAEGNPRTEILKAKGARA